MKKMKTLKAIPDGEFKVMHSEKNLAIIIKIGVGLSYQVKRELIKCIRANTHLFTNFSGEMFSIDPTVDCH